MDGLSLVLSQLLELSPSPLLRRRDVSPVALGLLNTQRDHDLVQMSSPTPQSWSNAEILVTTRLGQADHYAKTTYQKNSMSRRGIHPLLMGLDKPKPKPHSKKQTDLSGYESAQRKRFLRAELEEEKLAAAAGRRHLLKLERQVA